MNTAIIGNLEKLLAAVEAQPETLFDLSTFRVDTPCGTNFCTLGLACSMPEFQAQGFGFVASSFNKDHYITTVNGLDVRTDLSMVDPTFGSRAFRDLFRPAGDGWIDDDLGYTSSHSWNAAENDWDFKANMTDKALAVARLQHRINQLKGEQQ